ncbi:hypothetical protein RYX36_017954, partial [Vicia faba]
LWNGRNENVFRDKIGSVECWVEEVKWIKSKVKGFSYAFNQWIINPLGCLGIASAE